MLSYSILYVIIGILWSEWLEWFCVNNLEDKMGEPFTNREKLTHLIFWPITMGHFVYEFINNLLK